MQELVGCVIDVRSKNLMDKLVAFEVDGINGIRR